LEVNILNHLWFEYRCEPIFAKMKLKTDWLIFKRCIFLPFDSKPVQCFDTPPTHMVRSEALKDNVISFFDPEDEAVVKAPPEVAGPGPGR
jgi:hypothetical protein